MSSSCRVSNFVMSLSLAACADVGVRDGEPSPAQPSTGAQPEPGSSSSAAAATSAGGADASEDDGGSSSSAASETTGDVGPPFSPGPHGCITSVAPGVQTFPCDGLQTTVSAPSACLEAPCGVVLDIHGATMTADQQDANTNLRALGELHGYVVVQPTTDALSWSAGHEHRIMTGLQDVIAAFQIDEDRVHVTGFSAGGGVTWVLLCAYPEVFASAAPAAATGQYFGAAPVCFGSAPPSPELDILYMNGTADPFESMTHVEQLRDKILGDWAMDGGVQIDGDADFTRVRYQDAMGTRFELLTHDYQTDQSVGLPPLGVTLAGHCVPGSTDHTPTLQGQLAGYGCKGDNAFHWGETALQFFIDNPR